MANVQSQGIIFLRTGSSLIDRPGHQSRNIFLPHLPRDKKLVPKGYLAYYLKRSENLENLLQVTLSNFS